MWMVWRRSSTCWCVFIDLFTPAQQIKNFPKQLFQIAKLRKKVLRTTVYPLMEVESDFGPSQTPTASNNATQVIVQVSFPPNLVPREKCPGDEVAFHQDTSALTRLFTSTESWNCNQSQKWLLQLSQSLAPSQAPHKLRFNDLPPSDSVGRSWTSCRE